MSRQVVHDKMDFEYGRDVLGIEVWSDDPEPGGTFYDKPYVCLNVDPSGDDPSLFARLTITEARMLAVMLTKACERMDVVAKSTGAK